MRVKAAFRKHVSALWQSVRLRFGAGNTVKSKFQRATSYWRFKHLRGGIFAGSVLMSELYARFGALLFDHRPELEPR